MMVEPAHNLETPPTTELKVHPLAKTMPLMSDSQFQQLVQSIRDSGLLEPITLMNGEILDGRHRYRACREAGVEPRFEEFSGDNPLQFVLDRNVHRRHLTIGQRAMIAARLATLPHGYNQYHHRSKGDHERPPGLTAAEAGHLMGISRDSVHYAKAVINHGTPGEIASVENNEASVSTMYKIVNQRENLKGKTRPKSGGGNIMAKGRNRERHQKMLMEAELWEGLKVALDALTTLPLPHDIVGVVSTNRKRRDAVNNKLERALSWINEFSAAWKEATNARNGGGPSE